MKSSFADILEHGKATGGGGGSRLARLHLVLAEQAGSFLAVCLAWALLAQYLLDRRRAPGVSGALFVGAVALFVWLFGRQALEDAETGPARPGERVRWAWVGLAVPLGVLAFPRFANNHFSLDGTLLWLVGLALLGLAARPLAGRSLDTLFSRWPGVRGLWLGWHHLALLGIMALGAFYRLYRIGLIPSEMGCDLPHIYNNIGLLLQGQRPIFFPSYPGREGLFFYLAAPLAWVLGLSHTTIKVASALVGVLTLPAVYLLGQELYNREVGLYAAFFMSVSHWHIILTRVGFRLSTMPLMLALMLFFFVRAHKTGRRWFYALSGLFLGLGLYTYNAFMIVPLIVIGALVVLVLASRGRTVWRDWDGILLLVIMAVFVFIPLGRYAYEQPVQYFYRAATRVTGMEAPLPGDLLLTFLDNNRRALGMFNIEGDGIFVSNIPFMRHLGFFPAALFILGASYVLWRWHRGYNGVLLATLPILLLPTTLSLAFPQEVPNGGRAVGAIVPALLLAAVALSLVRRYTATMLSMAPQPWGRMARVFAGGVLATLLAFEAWTLYPLYFDVYVNHLPDRNFSISLAMAQAIDHFGDNGEAYILAQPHWHDGNAVRAQLRRVDPSWDNEIWDLEPNGPPLSGPPGRFMVIVHPQDTATLDTLHQAFPRGIDLHQRKPDGTPAFYLFYGER
jgi:uncharacterized membrane protein